MKTHKLIKEKNMGVRRRVGAAIFAILAVFAVTGPVLLSNPTPASAVGTIRLFEAFGTYALGAPNLSSGQPVVETVSGRDVSVVPQSGTNTNVKIVFNSNTHLCVAAVDGNEAIIVNSCSGLGTLWQPQSASCTECFKFRNNRETSLLGTDIFMYGANNGTPLYWAVTSAPGDKVWQELGAP
jgi:hypothetical protein